MYIKTTELPINNNKINILKKINESYFKNQGNWCSGATPVCDNETRPLGYELYVNVTVYIPYRPFNFSLFFNEYNTDKEIKDELKQLKYLTNNFKYKYIVNL